MSAPQATSITFCPETASRRFRLSYMKMDGYIRISRVGGREGESFISPKLQREQIETYAKLRGFTIDAWHEDRDVSGGTLERPGLERALARCQSGETGGIVAAKLDRLARSLVGLSQLVRRAKEESWTLVAVDHGLDLKTPGGALVANILGSVAQWELEQRRHGWDRTRAVKVGQGIHIASRTPTGYQRREDKRLEPDPVAAPVIRELFVRRARGEGWTALARYLDERGIRGPYRNNGWTPSAAAKIIRNRVYLGEARSGEHSNGSAHAPLVSPAEWEAAQGDRHVSSPRKGEGLLLSGLVRCAGCRYLLKPDSMRGRNGERIGMYRCRGRHAAGRCPAPASVLARVLDPYVEEHFLAAIGPDGPLAEAVEASVAVEKALQEVEDADRELDAFLSDVELRTLIGEDRYHRQAETRTQALADAETKLADARQRGALSGDLQTPGDLLEAWPALSVAEKRVLATASIDAVFVRRTGANVPVEDRALVLWRGEAPDGLPRRGHRVPLSSFAWPDEAPADVRVPVAEHA
jgi:DNA invertase Pin-like site-specific DNA recombinase